MMHQPVDHPDTIPAARRRARDWLLAIAVAGILSLCWAARDWSNLSWLILPDTDDMARLAQVRDWLAGQATNDWTQYRMGPPGGAPMHWSRVNDLPVALLILLTQPLLGRGGAEILAVIAYPAVLFACSLYLSARIARRLWGAQAGLVAIVLGAVALPGVSVFLPGRIDHHALQVVLMEIAILGAMARPRLSAGLVVGGTVALSVMIGLETVPQLAAVLIAVFARWSFGAPMRERSRLLGVGLGLAATTLPFLLFLRPTLWSPELCDAFSPASSLAAFAGAGALAALAGATPRLPDWRWRVGAGAVLGSAVLAAVLWRYPTCLSGPYGRMDPFLRREFLGYIAEANGVFGQDSVFDVARYLGLSLVACAASVWVARTQASRWRLWLAPVAVVIVSTLFTISQVRSTYIGAPVSVPIVAGLVLAARSRGRHQAAALVAAWLASAGLFWATAPVYARDTVLRALGSTPPVATDPPLGPRSACNKGSAWAVVDRYPPGRMMASNNLAAYALGATRMATVGAGYHRNDAGNVAMYHFFLDPALHGRAIAREWRVDYVAFCPGDFSETGVNRRFPNSVAAALNAGRTPDWLRQLPLHGTGLRLYRVLR